MPLGLIVLFIGIVLTCAAYYLTMPPDLRNFCRFGGIIAILLGIILIVYEVLSAGAHY